MDIELLLAQVERDITERFEPDYSMSNYDVYSFTQIWPNIDLGFGNDEYEAYTAALTIIFIAKDHHIAYVYFDNKFAYTANPNNKNFKHDLENYNMASIFNADKYQK